MRESDKKPAYKPPYKSGRKAVTRPIGEMIPGLTKRALGKYGFGQARLITDWPHVVGEGLAQFCQPLKLHFPPGKRVGGVLHIRVIGAMALELQHMEPLLVDRINTYFGYGAVVSIRLKQAGSLQAIRKKGVDRAQSCAKIPKLDTAQKQAIKAQVSHVENPQMRALLRRLGEAVIRRNCATKSS